MAAALAKLLRGGRSRTSSAPIPAIYRRGLQEVAGSSPASPHTGQWGNSLPQQRALPFGSRGVLSQEQKLVRMEQSKNYRTTCNLPRMGDGIKGLEQKYMRMYGSEVALLHLWNQMHNVRKLINAYKRSWPISLGIALGLVFSGGCILDGYTDYKRNEKILADTRSNVRKAATTVEGTKHILQELEEAICKEEGRSRV
ncbi:unnamed protein product [Urochloa humidicola]